MESKASKFFYLDLFMYLYFFPNEVMYFSCLWIFVCKDSILEKFVLSCTPLGNCTIYCGTDHKMLFCLRQNSIPLNFLYVFIFYFPGLGIFLSVEINLNYITPTMNIIYSVENFFSLHYFCICFNMNLLHLIIKYFSSQKKYTIFVLPTCNEGSLNKNFFSIH